MILRGLLQNILTVYFQLPQKRKNTFPLPFLNSQVSQLVFIRLFLKLLKNQIFHCEIGYFCFALACDQRTLKILNFSYDRLRHFYPMFELYFNFSFFSFRMTMNECVTLAARAKVVRSQNYGGKQSFKPRINLGFVGFVLKSVKILLLMTAVAINIYGDGMKCFKSTTLDAEEWTNYCKAKPYLFSAVLSPSMIRERRAMMPNKAFEARYPHVAKTVDNPFATDNMQFNYPLMSTFIFLFAIAILTLLNWPWKYAEAGSTSNYSNMLRRDITDKEENRKAVYQYVSQNLKASGAHQWKIVVYFVVHLFAILVFIAFFYSLVYCFEINVNSFIYKHKFTSDQVDPYQRNDDLGRHLPTTVKCLMTRFGISGLQKVEETTCSVPTNHILQMCVLSYACLFVFLSGCLILDLILQIAYLYLQVCKLRKLHLEKGAVFMLLLLQCNIEEAEFQNLKNFMEGESETS